VPRGVATVLRRPPGRSGSGGSPRRFGDGISWHTALPGPSDTRRHREPADSNSGADGPLPGPLEDQDPLGPADDGPDETHRTGPAPITPYRGTAVCIATMAAARSPHRHHAPGAARPRSRHHLRDQPRGCSTGRCAPARGTSRPSRGSPARSSRQTAPHRRSPYPAATRTPNRIPATALGLTHSGQPGSPENACRHHGPGAGSIIRAALDLAR
jgi:hypothetical protein